MNPELFIAFVRAAAAGDDAASNAARAIVHGLDEEGGSAHSLQEELREAAECEGVYQGIRELWARWVESSRQPA